VDDDILDRIEPQVLRGVADSAFYTRAVPEGEMQRRVRYDSNGQKIIEWIGPTSFVKEMGLPGRRVRSFLFDRSALRR
jgi:hypothetical protein